MRPSNSQLAQFRRAKRMAEPTFRWTSKPLDLALMSWILLDACWFWGELHNDTHKKTDSAVTSMMCWQDSWQLDNLDRGPPPTYREDSRRSPRHREPPAVGRLRFEARSHSANTMFSCSYFKLFPIFMRSPSIDVTWLQHVFRHPLSTL